MKIKTPSHVLIVEDDGDLLEVLKYVLEDAGYRVSTAADGEAALAIAGEDKVDLVLLDIGLPGGSGVAVARRLRSDPASAGVRSAIHTALAEATVRRELRDYDLFLAKSEDPAPLIAAIEAAMAKPSVARGVRDDEPLSFTLEDAVRAHGALRAAIGLDPRPLDAGEFVAALRPEIEQLLALAKTAGEIASLIASALGRDLGDGLIAHLAPPRSAPLAPSSPPALSAA